jgi:hypothetical protein
MKGYQEFNPIQKLVSSLGELPSFEAIQQARDLPKSKETEAIRDKERMAYASKKIKERKIMLGLIKEDSVPELVKPKT